MAITRNKRYWKISLTLDDGSGLEVAQFFAPGVKPSFVLEGDAVHRSTRDILGESAD